MDIYRGMSEREFVESIDASFFFDTEMEYENAVRIGCSISDNAALMIGYELIRGDYPERLEKKDALIRILKSERPTDIILPAVPIIELLIRGKQVPKNNLLAFLEACAKHGNAWNGLLIIEAADEQLEQKCDEIRQLYIKRNKALES